MWKPKPVEDVELYPCPFCGGKVVAFDAQMMQPSVYCPHCHITFTTADNIYPLEDLLSIFNMRNEGNGD